MTLNIGIPRWFLDERYFKNTDARQLVTEILNMYGKLFVPLTFNCREEIRNKYSCEHTKTHNQIRNLIDTAKKVIGLKAKLISITLHTEYQLPQWWDREFIEKYIQTINIVLKELQSNNINFSKLIVEIHPGFGGAKKERKIEPIVRGIVELVRGIIDGCIGAVYISLSRSRPGGRALQLTNGPRPWPRWRSWRCLETEWRRL